MRRFLIRRPQLHFCPGALMFNAFFPVYNLEEHAVDTKKVDLYIKIA